MVQRRNAMPVNPPPRHQKPAPPPAPPPIPSATKAECRRISKMYGIDVRPSTPQEIAHKNRREAIEYLRERSRIDVTNFDTLTDVEYAGGLLAAPRKKRMSRNGIEFEIEQELPETDDQRLRRMLAADAKAELQNAPTTINPAPPSRPVLTAAIYALTWLRVIYRELYGPAHLRRYL